MFSASEREIFSYQDGTRDTEGNLVTVYADPMYIDRAMSAALGGDVDAVIGLCQEYETDADGVIVRDPETKAPRRIQLPEVVHENYQKLSAAICKAFGLAPFNRLTGQGATTALLISQWNAYRSWVEKKDAPADSSPTSSPATPASP